MVEQWCGDTWLFATHLNQVPSPSRMPHLMLERPAAFAEDLKWRFLTCAALTVPIAYLAEPVQQALGLGVDKRLDYSTEIVLGLAAAIVIYGAWPFLTAAWHELRRARPGTGLLATIALGALLALVATDWYGPDRLPRVWEAVALIDALLLGHWLAVGAAARAGAGGPPFDPRAARRLAGTADVLTALAVAGATASLLYWILWIEGDPTVAVARAVAVLVSAAPLALIAAGRLAGRAAPASAGDGSTPTDFVVTHVLVPDGGSEEQVLALASVADGDTGVLEATRRAARARGVDTLAIGATAEPPARLLTTPAVQAAGIDAPLDAVGALNGDGTAVVWLVERWRVAGALALNADPASEAVNGAGPPVDLRRLRQNQALVAALQLAVLPVAGGALASFGVVLPPVAGALLAGLITALVAWNATR